MFRALGLTPSGVFEDARIVVWRSVTERQNCTLDVPGEGGRSTRWHVKRYWATSGPVSPAEEEARGIHALEAAGLAPPGFNEAELGRRLRTTLPEAGIEILSLKDWDLPLYVEHGVADCGFVGSDVLGEVDGELLVPLRLHAGRCRLSLLGKGPSLPAPGWCTKRRSCT